VQGPDIVEGPVIDPAPTPIAVNDNFLIDSSFATEGLIEEPVTSGADGSSWECDSDTERCEPNGGGE